MTKYKKLLAATVCISFVLTLFFSLFFIILETNHRCTGEDCLVCHEIQLVKDNLKCIGAIASTVLTAFALCCFSFIGIGVLCNNGIYYTLVSLKVKLSN